jgi:hypothetical protein
MSVWFLPLGIGAAPTAPAGPERGCGEYEFLFNISGPFPWPEEHSADLPVELLIGSLRWEGTAGLSTEPIAFPGLVVLLVESGRLQLYIGKDPNSDPYAYESLHVELSAGGVIKINPGIPINGRGEQGTAALLVGVAPAG